MVKSDCAFHCSVLLYYAARIHCALVVQLANTGN
jgi:hypothetical protein